MADFVPNLKLMCVCACVRVRICVLCVCVCLCVRVEIWGKAVTRIRVIRCNLQPTEREKERTNKYSLAQSLIASADKAAVAAAVEANEISACFPFSLAACGWQSRRWQLLWLLSPHLPLSIFYSRSTFSQHIGERLCTAFGTHQRVSKLLMYAYSPALRKTTTTTKKVICGHYVFQCLARSILSIPYL